MLCLVINKHILQKKKTLKSVKSGKILICLGDDIQSNHNWNNPDLFSLFHFCTIVTKNCTVSRIRTQIVRVEGILYADP